MYEYKTKIYKKIEGRNLENYIILRRISATKLLINKIEMKQVFALAFFHGNVSWKFVTTNYKKNLYLCFLVPMFNIQI